VAEKPAGFTSETESIEEQISGSAVSAVRIDQLVKQFPEGTTDVTKESSPDPTLENIQESLTTLRDASKSAEEQTLVTEADAIIVTLDIEEPGIAAMENPDLDSTTNQIPEAMAGNNGQALELPPPSRSFDKIREQSVLEWKPPCLPFVPASLSSTIEEAIARSTHSRRFDTPLGCCSDKLPSPEKQYLQWKTRFAELKQEMISLLEAREILRHLGIGKGIQEIMVAPTAKSPPLSSSPLKQEISESTQSQGISQKEWETIHPETHDIDKLIRLQPSTGLRRQSLGLLHLPAQGTAAARLGLTSKLSGISTGSISSNQSIASMNSNDTEAHFWSLDQVLSICAMVPDPSSFIDFDDNLNMQQRSGIANTGARGSLVMLPPPSCVRLVVPPLPQCVIHAMTASMDKKKKVLQNFPQLNKRLALRIDRNWHAKYQYLQWELCKTKW
jgi:hypothetical protein